MPHWMLDYKVASVPVASTTRSLTVERQRRDGSFMRTATIFGGVNLAPADESIFAYSDSDLRPRSNDAEAAPFIELASLQSDQLAGEIPEIARAADHGDIVQSVEIKDGDTIMAAALPGPETRAGHLN